MLRPRDHGFAALLSLLALAACTMDNPNFAIDREPGAAGGTSETGDDDTGDTRGAPTSSGGVTSNASSHATSDASDASSEASSDVSTSGVQPGTSGSETGSTGPTGATGETGESGDDTTGSGESSTGAPGPVTVDVPADIGTCVLLPRLVPYVPQASPSKCEAISAMIAGTESGVVTLDTALKEGAGQWREARIFLVFTVPAAPPGTTLTAATLTMHVGASVGADGMMAGALVAVEPFTLGELETDDPMPGAAVGVADGPALAGQAVHWPFTDPAQVLAGAPLFLAVVAMGDDGLIYESAAAQPDRRPTLTLTFE